MRVFAVSYISIYFVSLVLLGLGTVHTVQAPVSVVVFSLQVLAMGYECTIFIVLFLIMRKRHHYEYKRTKKTMLVQIACAVFGHITLIGLSILLFLIPD
mmetsp:Transcript_41941/g.64219  ORF Transcript_41941/g.64219 Transcript_41941/m.64219 type:complete len:99 (-) Transcript_41941:513-809(-)